jgi:hypothetical protein
MPQERESILDGKQPRPDGSVPVVRQRPLARRVLVVGRGLCRLCQPIVQVADPDPHRMAPLTAATAGRRKTAPTAGFPEGAPIPGRKRFTTSATVSGPRPEAKWGTLGAGLLQRELSMSTQRAMRHFGVAVMPGTAAVGMR